MDLGVIDFGGLRKGGVIDAATLERATGVSRASRDYSLAILGVREAVVRYFRDVRREVVTVAARGDALHVLADADAADYNADAFDLGYRKMLRAHRRNRGVDFTELPAESRAEHLRTLEVQARQLQALRAARRKQGRRLTVAAAPEAE